MERTVSVSFTALELSQIALALDDLARENNAFARFGGRQDGAFTVALLKIARGRLALGDIKGIDLHLPPWASAAIVDQMAPAAGVVLSAEPKARAARAPKAKRRTRRARRRLPGSAAAPPPVRMTEEVYDEPGKSHLEEVDV